MKKSEPKHTPGPWEIDRTLTTAIDKGKKHIAMVGFYKSPDVETCVAEEEHNANVRLIAEAPEMLAMLEELEWSDVVWCSVCGQGRKDGHAENCTLGSLLQRIRGEKG